MLSRVKTTVTKAILNTTTIGTSWFDVTFWKIHINEVSMNFKYNTSLILVCVTGTLSMPVILSNLFSN